MNQQFKNCLTVTVNYCLSHPSLTVNCLRAEDVLNVVVDE